MANHPPPPPPPPRVLLLSLAVSLLVVVNGCLVAAEEAQPADSVVRPRHQRFRGGEQDECQLNRLNSLQPTNRIQCEAGIIESWDPNEDEFRCAGVAVVRHIIEPNGLLLPSFTNAPQLIYIVEGLLYACIHTYNKYAFAHIYIEEGRWTTSVRVSLSSECIFLYVLIILGIPSIISQGGVCKGWCSQGVPRRSSHRSSLSLAATLENARSLVSVEGSEAASSETSTRKSVASGRATSWLSPMVPLTGSTMMAIDPLSPSSF